MMSIERRCIEILLALFVVFLIVVAMQGFNHGSLTNSLYAPFLFSDNFYLCHLPSNSMFLHIYDQIKASPFSL